MNEFEKILSLDAEVWFRVHGRILDKEGELITPVPNVLQLRLFDYYRICQLQRKPCLVQILKPRQKGASTIAQALIYHHLRRYKGLKGFLMGDIESTSDKVFEIFRMYAQQDTFGWAGAGAGMGNIMPGCDRSDEVILVNGSKWHKETAGSKNAGRGGTVQVAHFDEEAHYPFSSSRDPMLAALPSVHKHSVKSLLIRTTTPNGSQGTFYDDWFGRNPYENIFAAWFEFPDSMLPFESEDEKEEFAASLSKDEKEEMERFRGQVSLAHLKWRRYTIETDCKGDPDRFKQEYPSDPISCFLKSSRPRYSTDSLQVLHDRAEQNQQLNVGTLILQANDSGVLWVPDDEGDLRRFEEPKFGCHYLVSVDTCSGEDQQQGGKTADPDYHDAQVWRRGYFDPSTGNYMHSKMVMRHSSRLDSDILVEIVVAMSLYYGKCLVVPEVNGEAGLHLIKMLVSRRIPVFRRTSLKANTDSAHDSSKKLEPYGWRTNEVTRRMIVDSLVAPIRECEIDFSDPEIISQLQRFIVNKRGKAEAMPGFHDDAVLSSCIGHYCLPSATEFRMPYRRNVNLRRLARDPNYMAPDGFQRDV